MKILLVADKEKTAIHRLCVYTEQSNPHHDFKIVCVHPKRPSQEQLEAFESAYNWCDVVDYRYWRTAENMVGVVGTGKPSILTHYNPYDLKQRTWTNYKKNIVVNGTQKTVLKSSPMIPLPVDFNFWKMKPDFDEARLNVVIMVANRIQSEKGILPVVQATKELGMTFLLVGRPSKPDYLREILKYDHVQYYEGISDEELRELYYKSGIHVCNSKDDFESGTMPILEAIACGVPVLTRLVGHVPDIWDGTNLVVNKGAHDDVESIKDQLSFMRENPLITKKMREKAWHAIKYRNIELYGRKYSKIYHSLMNHPNDLISVILPTCNRPEQLKRGLVSLAVSSIKHFEVVVVDDSGDPKMNFENAKVIQAVKEATGMTIKYFTSDHYHRDGSKVYGLAAARNKGVIEAEGKWIMLMDDRFELDPETMRNFYDNRNPRVWQFGIKDGHKKGFVENLSFVSRPTLIRMGMFNQQLETYGGMTQDLSKRSALAGVRLQPNDKATATSQIKSNNRNKKYQEIVESKTLCYKLYEENQS